MTDARSPLQRAITALAARRSLAIDEAEAALTDVVRGEATAAQLGALLLGLRVRGETPEEVVGAARALRAAMVRVPAGDRNLIDICGTGGGTVSTFNISTVAALVAAGAGASVAKYGNRSVTSACGSADVVEALGIRVLHDAAGAAHVLQACRITLLFSPQFHPGLTHAGSVSRELGGVTLLNLAGPLANPAGVSRRVIGVADPDQGPTLAEALRRLGAVHALVVHGRAGLDEISPHGLTDVWEVRGEEVSRWAIDPAIYRLAVGDLAALGGGPPAENAARIEALVAGGVGDPSGTAATLLNAGAAIYVAGLAASYAEGIGRARHVLGSGAARAVLDKWRKASVSTSG